MEHGRAPASTIGRWELPSAVRLATGILVALTALDWILALTHRVSRPGCRIGALCSSSGGLAHTRLSVLVIGGGLNLVLVGMLRSRRQAFFVTTIVTLLTLGWVINGFIAESPAQTVTLQAVNVLIIGLLAMGGHSYMDMSTRNAGGHASDRAVESPMDTPGGWHPDPSGRYQLRYWDGVRWTEHVSTDATAGSDPP